jgi:SAM-dependent methyltransferase
MIDDTWLERWLPLLASRVGDLPVLELGCGGGRDSQVLAGAGHRVVGVDLSASEVTAAAALVPSGEFHCQDIRAPFPISVANVVLASLSLHYFPWPETLALVARIREVLRPGGLLLCRLNSTEDHNFGASGHPQIEKNYYLVNGEPKRFFDRAAIEELFATGWNALEVRHQLVGRYSLPKAVWEAGFERAA